MVNTPRTLHLLPILTHVWNGISMYFIFGLPKSCNKVVIMVVVEHFSRYSHFCSISHPFSHSFISKYSWLKSLICIAFPLPLSCIWDPTFANKFWQELIKFHITQVNIRISYHPKTNDQINMFNKFLKTYF